MKPGIETAEASITVTVTTEMLARLDGREIHPVYSTFWASYHCEVAARKAIEPFFEEHENAVGSALALRHLAMAAVGTVLRVQARVSSVSGNRITCDVTVLASESRTILAQGTQEQVVLPDSKLKSLVLNAIEQ